MKRFVVENTILIFLMVAFLIALGNRWYAIKSVHQTDEISIHLMDNHFRGVIAAERLSSLLREEENDYLDYLIFKNHPNFIKKFEMHKKGIQKVLKILFNPAVIEVGGKPVLANARKKALLLDLKGLVEMRESFFSRKLSPKYSSINSALNETMRELLQFETHHYQTGKEAAKRRSQRMEAHLSLTSTLSFVVIFFVLFVVVHLERKTRKAVQDRDTILSVVSHDLKNPLSSIALSSQAALRNLPRDHKLYKKIKTIEAASAIMNDLVSNLLDRVKIESGHLKLELKNEDLTSVIEEAESLLAPIAFEKNIKIENICHGDHLKVLCDKVRLIQIISNLLGNSIKFMGPGGKITIETEIQKELVTVSIIDNGPGISQKELPYLFSRYWQSHKTRSLGTGLGLYIVKGLVEAHGGKIWVKSSEGTGSTFSFSLHQVS